MASGKLRWIAPSRFPEAEGEEMPVCEEDSEDAAREGNKERVYANGGMNFGARNSGGKIQADQRQSRKENCAEEK